jgi:hypothetical protein
MAYRLAIIDPPEADCFSFAVACIPAYGAAQRQMKIIYFSATFAALAKLPSPRREQAGGEYLLKLFGVSSYIVADAPKPLASFAIVARATAAEWRRSENATYFVILLV